MRSIRQLLRQPVKTAAGVVMIALAAAILVTCAGQYLAAGLTRDELEYNYNTVALTTRKYSWEHEKWIQETAEAHPEMIKTISDTGLFSAYIPELVLDNYTQHFKAAEGFSGSNSGIFGMPYSCAVLEVVLTEISPDVKDVIKWMLADGNRYEERTAVKLICKGTVERAVCLQEGYNDPAGYSIELTFRTSDEAALAALGLEVGGRYLVYGMDYYDNDFFVRSIVSADQANFSRPIDMSKVHTQKPKGYPVTFFTFTGSGELWYYENIVDDEKSYIEVYEGNLAEARSCRLTVCDYSSLPEFVTTFDEYGYVTGVELLYDQRLLLEDESSVPYIGQSGMTVVSAEEYIAAYGVPTVARLDGTAEEFLASEAGAAWRKAMETAGINYHAFPVLAVDKLGYQAEFARGRAEIVEGRDFTQAELDAGKQVCILSQSLAEANGLKLGDTVTLQSYAYDPNVNEDVGLYPNLRSPWDDFYVEPGFYSSSRGFAGEPETYTIVGLYSRENAWQDASLYAFTPNTIFIPKASTGAPMVMSTEGVFRSYVLENGAEEAFDALVKEAGYSGLFVYYDQGYNQVKAGLDAYESVSGRALYVGAAASLGILLLYILLFPLRQRRHLASMSILGANRGQRLAHMAAYNLGMLFPGIVLGTLVGALVWEQVTQELMASVDALIPLRLDPWMIAVIGGLLFLFMAVVLLACALLQTREGKYMGRKD